MKLVISAPGSQAVGVKGGLQKLFAVVRDDVKGRGGTPTDVQTVMFRIGRPVRSIRGANYTTPEGDLICNYRITKD